jgi:LmbE family N-acetylglucosaminyl deacetylase
MRRAISVLSLLPLVGLLLAGSPTTARLEVGSGERLLVIAPHPDDETLGAGGLAQRVLARGGSARVLIATAGDRYTGPLPPEASLRSWRVNDLPAYAQRRMGEARAAARELGIGRVRLQFLGFPDAGLAPLLQAHWRRTHPARLAAAGAAEPPYPEVLDPEAAYSGEDLLREIGEVLRDEEPTVVALPDPADMHPDHSATGLFALLALEEYARLRVGSNGTPLPRILLYLVHWRAWPAGFASPTPPGPDTSLELPELLPDPGLARVALHLSDAERRTKAAALARHASQQEIMGSFLRAFVRRTEPFRVFGAPALARVAAAVERSITLAEAARKGGETPRAGDPQTPGASPRSDLPAQPAGHARGPLLGAQGKASPVLR